jgi:hypothetical protein
MWLYPLQYHIRLNNVQVYETIISYYLTTYTELQVLFGAKKDSNPYMLILE